MLWGKSKMKKKLLSVIIPVYNVEQYLKRCLDSVVAQSLQEIEIIIVNDGSTDSSEEICEEYAKQDSRIVMIHQNNQGISAARNAGINAASTEYLMFVDSDDWVVPEFCQCAYEAIVKKDADLILFDFYSVNQAKMWIQTDLKEDIIDLSKDEAMTYLIEKIGNNAWNKIYSAKLFQNLKFPVGRNYEDIGTVCFLVEKAEKIGYLNKALYYYCYREKSISKRPSKKSLEDRIEMLYKQWMFMESHNYSVKRTVYGRLLNTTIFYLLSYGLIKEKNKNHVLNTVLKHCKYNDWKQLSVKRKLVWLGYRFCPETIQHIRTFLGKI